MMRIGGRYGLGYILLGILLLSLLYLTIWINSRWEQVLYIAGEYILAAAIVGSLPLVYTACRDIQRDSGNNQVNYSPLLTLLVFIIGSPMFLFSCGYVLTITLNTFIPPQTDIVYKGRIIARYYLLLDETDSYGLELRLKVSPSQYRCYAVGDRYVQYMQRGGLGIDYRLSW